MKRCHKCTKEWVSSLRQPAVKEVCEGCNAYLHCCLNCRFRDPGKHNQCAIPNTDWVGDRAGCNFCDEFEFKDTEPGAEAGGGNVQAQQAFNDLFGDGEAPSAKPSFDDLFGNK